MNRLVLVEWDDAWSDNGWASEIDPTACPVSTVGWVVIETEEGILLAQTLSKDNVGSMWFIPNGMINSVTYLKEGDPA